MIRKHGQPRQSIFALAGWLFADLLLVLTLIFLATEAPWIPDVNAANPTPPPVICGLNPNDVRVVTITATDPYGLRAQTALAEARFRHDLLRNADLIHDNQKHEIAGLVEVFGDSPDVGDGIQFAAGAIAAMKTMAQSHFVFSTRTTYFKPLWNESDNTNQLVIYVYYFLLAQNCGAG